MAFPTETVYGLAVRANDPKASTRLRQAKGRSEKKPFQVIVAGIRDAKRICPDMPESAMRLAKRFWPGPLTLVVKNRSQRWTGLRLPDHGVARRLAAYCGGAIVATSANISGEQPALTAREAAVALEGRVGLILDGGPAALRLASTVVKCGKKSVCVLREGAIPLPMIMETVGSDTG